MNRPSLLLLSLPFAALHFLSATSQAWADSGYMLTQTSKLQGPDPVTIFLTPSAIKIVDRTTNIVCKSPDWQISIYNKSSRTIYQIPLDKFKGFGGTGLAAMMKYKQVPVPLAPTAAKGTVLGRVCQVYKTPAWFTNEQNKKFKTEVIGGSAVRTAQAFTADWKLPKQESYLMCRYFAISDIPDVPLKYDVIDEGDELLHLLDTTKIVQKPLAASEFEIPASFRRVKSIEAVRIDATGEDGMTSILDGLDMHLKE